MTIGGSQLSTIRKENTRSRARAVYGRTGPKFSTSPRVFPRDLHNAHILGLLFVTTCTRFDWPTGREKGHSQRRKRKRGNSKKKKEGDGETVCLAHGRLRGGGIADTDTRVRGTMKSQHQQQAYVRIDTARASYCASRQIPRPETILILVFILIFSASFTSTTHTDRITSTDGACSGRGTRSCGLEPKKKAIPCDDTLYQEQRRPQGEIDVCSVPPGKPGGDVVEHQQHHTATRLQKQTRPKRTRRSDEDKAK